MHLDFGKIFQSKFFGGMVFGIAAFLVLAIVFKGGLVVGAKRADFACRWNSNYHTNFAGPRAGFAQGFGDRDFIDANGTLGQIIKIDGQSFTIAGRDNVEKVIIVGEYTAIKSMRDALTIADLKVDDFVIVIGEPNENGQISAKLIRLIPEMEVSGDRPSTTPKSAPKMPPAPQR